MNLSEYILNDIKPLSSTDKISDLQLLFNQLTYSHIPIKNQDGVYIGCVSENDAHCFKSTEVISDITYSVEGFFVREETNWLDVLEAFAQNHANIMPVLSRENKYLGYYELNDVIGLFNETPFFAENGGMNFNRQNLSIEDLVKMAKKPFSRATDEYIYENDLFDFEGECGSRCVVF